MSTPPNPPSPPTGPPKDPAGAPIPEAAPGPDPLPRPRTPEPPLSLEKPQPPDRPRSAAQPPAPVPPAAERPATPVQPPAPEQTAPPEQPQPGAAPEPNPFAPPAPGAPTHPAHPTGPTVGGGFAAPGGHGGFDQHGPQGAGGPGPGGPHGPGPAHPWAPPGTGFGGGPYPGYPQALPMTNGLAVAALVVGIAGVLIALVPFFFWAGAILAATALGLGIGALVRASKGAPRKAMAVTGTVLGVVGLGASVAGVFLSAYLVEEATDRAGRSPDRQERELIPYPDASPKPMTPPSPSQVPGLTSALPFGETFTYDNGVKVSLSAPKKYKPKGILAREQVKNAIQITVTITNGSAEPHEVIHAVPNVRDDKGMTAELVFDSDGSGGGVPKMVRGSILPGQSASGVVAYEVPEGTASISADISAGTLLDDVKYAGPVT
ncbi:DUF4190 domain-containing protein [Streptomyces subrutilus]|uniref:DUF4352 domain-containing protein n=1 Tax=Streptomyces subrutilus TaxID=36818 RepID=A0A1E5PQZ1_9ACTN|nr:DUF4190 domain-containing protein [Streptomyces subrutilus]OEJ31782.1 hypothetical protein BGK67_10875 [Streptomyces subrutilus]